MNLRRMDITKAVSPDMREKWREFRGLKAEMYDPDVSEKKQERLRALCQELNKDYDALINRIRPDFTDELTARAEQYFADGLSNSAVFRRLKQENAELSVPLSEDALAEIVRSKHAELEKDNEIVEPDVNEREPTEKAIGDIRDWAICPVEYSRRGIFWVLSRKQKKMDLSYQAITYPHPWGTVTIKGPVLGDWEKRVFYALLRLKDPQTDVLTCSYAEIIRALGIAKYGALYTEIKQAIENLASITIFLDHTSDEWKFFHVLEKGYFNADSKKFEIETGPGLREIPGIEHPHRLHIEFSLTLKTQVARALFDFYQTQSEPKPYHFRWLAKTIMLDLAFSDKEIKRQLRRGLKELVGAGYLESFKITRKGIVFVNRA